MKKIIALTLAICLSFALAGCGDDVQSTNLMDGITRNDIAPIVAEAEGDQTQSVTDLAVDIFKTLPADENSLISPLSIASALSMTASGADGETLEQMEEVLGADISALNEFLYAYDLSLPTSENTNLALANSIWLKDREDLLVNEEFLQTNKDYFDAEIYKTAFDDDTKNDINNWVNAKTDGQIDTLLEEPIPEETVMYLINALSFDANWQNPYEDYEIEVGEFYNVSGEIENVDFMHSSENYYIEMEGATGFAKAYEDFGYYFVALLPDDDLGDFIADLDGDEMQAALENIENTKVITSMPKFEFDYSQDLSEILINLGMEQAFNQQEADFTNLATIDEGNIYISQVLHKTKIAVDQVGTKAGAVTSVIMTGTTAAMVEPETVNLDRPFMFLIVDANFNLPIFMGIVNSVE